MYGIFFTKQTQFSGPVTFSYRNHAAEVSGTWKLYIIHASIAYTIICGTPTRTHSRTRVFFYKQGYTRTPGISPSAYEAHMILGYGGYGRRTARTEVLGTVIPWVSTWVTRVIPVQYLIQGGAVNKVYLIPIQCMLVYCYEYTSCIGIPYSNKVPLRDGATHLRPRGRLKVERGSIIIIICRCPYLLQATMIHRILLYDMKRFDDTILIFKLL